MEQKELIQRLGEVSIFETLTDDELKSIIERSQLLSYKKDDVVLFESELGNALYIILDGFVKISRTNEDYKEVILAILAERDFFGEMSVLDGAVRSADAIAISKVHALKIAAEDFLDLLEKNPKISLALLREMVSRLRKTDHQIKSISLSDAIGKVASVILRLANDVGRQRRGRVEIDNFASQQEMANYAATSRETISRVLSMFERDGLIERDMNKIIITDFEAFKQKFS
ncbi:transcriptional regulator, Crp/Fnr family [Chloroherpeton thalassium ATCC 35110]|uniref:Transcriptional regulator, Crp/Fnr family n=1 Tax=Chloroherpeton thalassium (strain ATCC 35110 / GB-78) TaxID=517418 RepID=B3QXY7_CHLT3|nr:Crp/Fnr family transcriptional regulator [Chloroherpeton thalassium]ACF13515.1 transcriptional regulator, Crp/Fnr family [Chloroherpeton thalassium ATCC 35110]